jgi:RimJ/RimL family protein N-acetyltransferase
MAVIESRTVMLKDGRQVCIRTPVADDTPAAIEYIKTVFADDHFFLTTAEEMKVWQTPEKEQEHIQKYYDDENKLMVISEVDEQIVSMSNIESGVKKRIQHVGYLGISILPDYRGIGLGTAVMEAMIEWGVAHPVIEKLTLGVWASNEPALRLYQKMGFVEEGRKVRDVKYANGYYDDCILMYKMVKPYSEEVSCDTK